MARLDVVILKKVKGLEITPPPRKWMRKENTDRDPDLQVSGQGQQVRGLQVQKLSPAVLCFEKTNDKAKRKKVIVHGTLGIFLGRKRVT